MGSSTRCTNGGPGNARPGAESEENLRKSEGKKVI